MKNILVIAAIFCGLQTSAQTNIFCSHPQAESILSGNYDPADFVSSNPISHPDSITHYIQAHLSADSLKSFVVKLATFYNRNSGSDTVSSVTGMGAARNWVLQKFMEFSAQAENRLIPSFLNFDRVICGITHHKNIFAVLPGTDTANHRVLIVEGHIDSRCEGECDTVCRAEGIEDNASGTALVMEMARVMSHLSPDYTLVFLVTTAEEQGLLGAEAFADYTTEKDIPVLAVLNNDVIGGILCGETSSPPSCPGVNAVDSTQVRLFSQGNFNSRNKQYARYTKLQYKEQLLPLADVPMLLTIMSAEDRTGRGGDHIPFRQKGYPSIRLTSANEHGDANVANPNYTDRQHTSRDTLGIDTNGDMAIDSFFVDFHYLTRNAAINANAMGMAAISPPSPTVTAVVSNGLVEVTIHTSQTWPAYRIALRTTSHDWDTVYMVTDTFQVLSLPTGFNYIISAANVNAWGVESLFSNEVQTQFLENPAPLETGVVLLQNRPNPFDEATYISIQVNAPVLYKSAFIRIRDMQGRIIQDIPVELQEGLTDVLFTHGYGQSGALFYSLWIDGRELDTKTMIFAN